LNAMVWSGSVRPTPIATAFRRAVRYEWRHLTALRSTWILLAVVAVLSCVNGAVLVVGLEPGEAPSVATVASALQFDGTASQLPLSALLMLPFATGPVTTDLARGVARTTWLTVGGRATAFGAKIAVGAAVGASVALVSVALGVLCGAVALAVGGAGQPDWSATAGPVLVYILFMACWPMIGASVAALVRNRVAAALALVLWPLIGERIVGLLLGKIPGLGGVGDWLPFAAARAALSDLDAVPPDERGFMAAMIGSDLSSATGLAVFCTFTAAIVAAGTYVYGRRNAP
jgi:hypothetical protein